MKARIIQCRKERPILFADSMVWSILTGRKTATRRKLSFKAEVGDVLWVREAWAYLYKLDSNDKIIKNTGKCYYRADGYNPTPFNCFLNPKTGELDFDRGFPYWKPSIHMPRAACRIFLEVVAVREQKLWDMTQADALAEGVWFDAYQDGWIVGKEGGCFHASQPLRSFEKLWQSCYGDTKLDWETNPVVKVIEFKRAEVKK